jgi:hypothetical protein
MFCLGVTPGPLSRKLTGAQRIIRVLSPSVKIFFTFYLNFLSNNLGILARPPIIERRFLVR